MSELPQPQKEGQEFRLKIINAFIVTDGKINNLPKSKDKKAKIEKYKKDLYYFCLTTIAQELGELGYRISVLEKKINSLS
jgi:hypothetical protein